MGAREFMAAVSDWLTVDFEVQLQLLDPENNMAEEIIGYQAARVP